MRILILGGYGGFGGRLSRRLAANGHEVLVAGRSVRKAQAFCRAGERMQPLLADRNSDLRPLLAAERPDILIDAAGPFQGSHSGVVEACLEERVAYIDIADAREFVTGIERFDVAARKAGVPLLSGASSVPALSGAIVRHLASGCDRVTSVGIAITASSKAAAGTSVAQAILAGAGKPFRLWREGRFDQAFGWQRPVRLEFRCGQSNLGKRMVALVDVPDLDLLPRRYPDLSTVEFHAGTESRLGNLALWLASWPVRWGWVRSLIGIAPLLQRAQRLSAQWGSDRSGMIVRLLGEADGQRVSRQWTLLAEDGDGPEIPALAAALAVGRVTAGRVPPGARAADDLFSLDDFEPLFRTLAIRHETVEHALPPPLYQRVMGAEFDRLAPALKSIHSPLGESGASGRANVTNGRNVFARMIGVIMGFPAAGEHPVHVHFRETKDGERWTRDFGGTRFSSTLGEWRGLLVERFGPLRFAFALEAKADGGLRMQFRDWRLGPLRMPKALAPCIVAREHASEGRFHFDVAVGLPLVGEVVQYHGWLETTVSAQNGTSSSRSLSNTAG